MLKILRRGVLACVFGAAVAGCENNTETGALVGAGGGAVAGGAIGSISHSRAGEGALIGAAVGALGGAFIGHGMDENNGVEHGYVNDRDYDRRHAIGNPINKTDVISWSSRGINEEVIIDRIDRSGTVFHLTAADVNELRDRGVSPSVVAAMRDTARR